MNQEKNTRPVVCLQHYLNCFRHFNRASIRNSIEPDKETEVEHIQRRHALECFIYFLKNREIEHIQQVDLFIVEEYVLHLEEMLSSREHSPQQNGEYKYAIQDFLNYCAKSLYLPENPAEDIL